MLSVSGMFCVVAQGDLFSCPVIILSYTVISVVSKAKTLDFTPCPFVLKIEHSWSAVGILDHEDFVG